MLKISWCDPASNVEVWRRMNKTNELLFTIQKRKLEYYDYTQWNEK